MIVFLSRQMSSTSSMQYQRRCVFKSKDPWCIKQRHLFKVKTPCAFERWMFKFTWDWMLVHLASLSIVTFTQVIMHINNEPTVKANIDYANLGAILAWILLMDVIFYGWVLHKHLKNVSALSSYCHLCHFDHNHAISKTRSEMGIIISTYCRCYLQIL